VVNDATPRQTPFTQLVAAQTTPQPPQFALSVCVFVQYGPASEAPPSTPQRVSVALHVPVQTLPLHASPPAQTWPQAPQLALSLLRFAQEPPASAPPSALPPSDVPPLAAQRLCPAAQEAEHVAHVAQTPPLHDVPAVHAVPQVPQFTLSVCVSAQNGPASALHMVCVAAHTEVHAPAVQAFPAGHTVPHFPQLVGSVPSVAHVVPHMLWVAGHATTTIASGTVTSGVEASDDDAVTGGSSPTQASRSPAEKSAPPSATTARTADRRADSTPAPAPLESLDFRLIMKNPFAKSQKAPVSVSPPPPAPTDGRTRMRAPAAAEGGDAPAPPESEVKTR
jgi:hypothetical protein